MSQKKQAAQITMTSSAPVVRVDPPQPRRIAHIELIEVLDDDAEPVAWTAAFHATDGNASYLDMRAAGGDNGVAAATTIAETLAKFFRVKLRRATMNQAAYDELFDDGGEDG